MKLHKSVRTIWIRKDELVRGGAFHLAGPIPACTLKPMYLRRPKGYKGKWSAGKAVWVEFQAISTFTVKEKRKRK